MRRGRLPIPLLVQHTRLNPKHLRHGLAVLVQQNLVYHYVELDSRTTYYEANPGAAYALARAGKILTIVKSRYGATAEDVVQNLLLLGHTKVEDLQVAYSSKGPASAHATTNGATTNGTHADANPTHGQLNYTLCLLLENGIIEPVTEAMFRSPADTYNLIEKDIIKGIVGGVKGARAKEEVKGRIRDQLKNLREQGRDWRAYVTGYKGSVSGRGQNGADKRRKLENGVGSNGVESGEGIKIKVSSVQIPLTRERKAN
jgi:DNA-directed RNA polymerase III subunit RPC3